MVSGRRARLRSSAIDCHSAAFRSTAIRNAEVCARAVGQSAASAASETPGSRS